MKHKTRFQLSFCKLKYECPKIQKVSLDSVPYYLENGYLAFMIEFSKTSSPLTLVMSHDGSVLSLLSLPSIESSTVTEII